MPWADRAGAVAQVWFGGQEMGNAVVDVLTGQHRSGRSAAHHDARAARAQPVVRQLPGRERRRSATARACWSATAGTRPATCPRALPVRPRPVVHDLRAGDARPVSSPTFAPGTPLTVEVDGDQHRRPSRQRGGAVLRGARSTPPCRDRPRSSRRSPRCRSTRASPRPCRLELGERAFAHWQAVDAGQRRAGRPAPDVADLVAAAVGHRGSLRAGRSTPAATRCTSGARRPRSRTWPRSRWSTLVTLDRGLMVAVQRAAGRPHGGAHLRLHRRAGTRARGRSGRGGAAGRGGGPGLGPRHVRHRQLAARLRRRPGDDTPDVPWGDVVVFHMDEYVGAGPDHPAGLPALDPRADRRARPAPGRALPRRPGRPDCRRAPATPGCWSTTPSTCAAWASARTVTWPSTIHPWPTSTTRSTSRWSRSTTACRAPAGRRGPLPRPRRRAGPGGDGDHPGAAAGQHACWPSCPSRARPSRCAPRWRVR